MPDKFHFGDFQDPSYLEIKNWSVISIISGSSITLQKTAKAPEVSVSYSCSLHSQYTSFQMNRCPVK